MLDLGDLMAFVGYSITMLGVGVRIGLYIAKSNRHSRPNEK
jgi:hypothetical protein